MVTIHTYSQLNFVFLCYVDKCTYIIGRMYRLHQKIGILNEYLMYVYKYTLRTESIQKNLKHPKQKRYSLNIGTL